MYMLPSVLLDTVQVFKYFGTTTTFTSITIITIINGDVKIN